MKARKKNCQEKTIISKKKTKKHLYITLCIFLPVKLLKKITKTVKKNDCLKNI